VISNDFGCSSTSFAYLNASVHPRFAIDYDGDGKADLIGF